MIPFEAVRPEVHRELYSLSPGLVWGLVLLQGLPGSRTNVDLGAKP